MANQSKKKLATWIRIDGSGNTIPGSCIERPLGVVPKGGRWKQIMTSVCCDCPCVITFYSNTSNGNITSIVSADGSVNWSGTLTTGDYKSFVNPNCYDMSYTVTFGVVSSSGVDIAGTAVQGDGDITIDDSYVAAGAAGQTITLSTTAVYCSEYLVTLTDD